MKLLFCFDCWDVFKLDYELRQCKCGEVKGKYLPGGHKAVVNGKGHSIAIGNGSLRDAIINGMLYEKDDPFHKCKVVAWARPHNGDYNPNTIIKEDL